MPRDLREEILSVASTILKDEGPDALSLREVARRLGVSHQAPYKHFSSKEAVFAELVRRAYADFAQALAAGEAPDDPEAALGEMGRKYLLYAAERPFEYRLMFSMPLPDLSAHPGMVAEAHAAFDLLRDALARLRPSEHVHADALYVWSVLHGLASLGHARVLSRLGLADAGPEQVLARIKSGLT